MKVIAKPGTQCPKEGKPREYITDSGAVDVPETAYYKRLVDDGSLVIQEPEAGSRKSEEKTSKGGKG